MNTKEITGTTKLIFDYIVNFFNEHGYSPSIREIATANNVKSTSTVFYHLEKLERANLLKKSQMKNRAITITAPIQPQGQQSVNNDITTDYNLLSIPILGKVAAGLPTFAAETASDSLLLPENLFHGNELFFLRVSGDSMINAGIFEGDLIAVNKQYNANNGDIVVAMLGDEATVKRFYKENDYIRLQAENDSYTPIISKNIKVIGKVVGLIRKAI